MPKNVALKNISESLHLSHSQVFTYLNCSLKYRFQYVEQRQIERISIALIFGSAIHSAIEAFYLGVKHGIKESLESIQEVFDDHISAELNLTDVPVIYKKGTKKDSTISMGKALLETFYENVNVGGYEIVGVEVPLSARLYTENAEPTDFQLIGIIDLILKNIETDQIILVDNKTAAKAKTQKSVNEDLQLTAYSYLAAANKLCFPRAEIKCRFDVLLKLKTPKMKYYTTNRTAKDRKKFTKLANMVLKGIEERIFFPNKSWLCADCSFKNVCKDW